MDMIYDNVSPGTVVLVISTRQICLAYSTIVVGWKHHRKKEPHSAGSGPEIHLAACMAMGWYSIVPCSQSKTAKMS